MPVRKTEILPALNFATLPPISENAEIVIAGQTGTGKTAPNRFETNFKFRPNRKSPDSDQTAQSAKLGKIKSKDDEKSLGQFSFQALDEWKIREGVIFVFGFDYSRFIGAGDDFSISPRFGLQFDINSKTRFRTAYTTQTEEQTLAKGDRTRRYAGSFPRTGLGMQDFVVENDKPQMNKSRRLEFGIERVLTINQISKQMSFSIRSADAESV